MRDVFPPIDAEDGRAEGINAARVVQAFTDSARQAFKECAPYRPMPTGSICLAFVELFFKLHPVYIAGARVAGAYEEGRERVAYNTPGVFLAILRVALGRVRPSVRWRIPAVRRTRVAVRQLLWIRRAWTQLDCYMPANLSYADVFGDVALWYSLPEARRAFTRRQRVTMAAYSRQLRLIRARQKFDGPLSESLVKRTPEQLQAIDDRFSSVLHTLRSGQMPTEDDVRWLATEGDGFKNLFSSWFTGIPTDTGAAFFRLMRHVLHPDRFAALLKYLSRESFRALLKRATRVSHRRMRVPRPLHAHPRPPTAPLAPPV